MNDCRVGFFFFGHFRGATNQEDMLQGGYDFTGYASEETGRAFMELLLLLQDIEFGCCFFATRSKGR